MLTDLGRELAHLPVDPTVGRMILQARTEKAMREVLIIAAALSIQDPRERPLDQQQKADLAHRRFNHPDSDFLALLAIWEIYHDEFEKLSLGKLRKFCTAHFLSFTRMREWRDVHSQLEDTLRGAGRVLCAPRCTMLNCQAGRGSEVRAQHAGLSRGASFHSFGPAWQHRDADGRRRLSCGTRPAGECVSWISVV